MKSYTPEASPFAEETLLANLSPNLRQELEQFAEARKISLTSFLESETASDYEDIIEAVLHTLPQELIAKRTAEYRNQGTSLADALHNSMEFIRQRSVLWKYDGEEKYESETLKTIKIFESAKYQQNLFEGKGNAAYVFQVPEVPNVCIKFLHTPSMQRYSPEREYGILKTVDELSTTFEALRVPMAHGVAVHMEATKSFFTMETINGMTLLQLVESPGERKAFLERAGLSESYIISMLKNKELVSAMTRDLERIHQNGILHGDIHPRNIMIDSEGKFYLIDFGNGLLTSDLPVGMDYETIENRKELDVSTFRNCFVNTAHNLQEQVKDEVKMEI